MTDIGKGHGTLLKDRAPRQMRVGSGRSPRAFALYNSFLWLGCVFVFLSLCLAIAESATPALRSSAPYLSFREKTLGYHGSDDELTNHTEIRIGWFGPTNLCDPLTGDLWWAANLAVRQANAGVASKDGTGESHLPFRLIPRWAPDPWGSGVSQLARMVYDEEPYALLGSVDSASTHLAEQVVAKANLPLMSPIATDKSVTLAGVSWAFSCAPSDKAIARALVDHILGDRGLLVSPGSVKRISLALINGTDHESRMMAREALKIFSSHEVLPSLRLEVNPGAQDLLQQIAALQENHPVAVLIIAAPEDSARLVRAVRENLKCLIYGSHAMGRPAFLELAGSASEGACFPLLFIPDASDSDAKQFVENFLVERGKLPDYAAALTYDATRLLIAAIRQAGPSRPRIRQALGELCPWRGVAGIIQFDGTGQNSRTDICMGTIRNGAVARWMSSPDNPDR